MHKKIALNILYPIVLLASTLKRKTCESLGAEANKTGDMINRSLEQMTLQVKDFVNAAQKILKKNDDILFSMTLLLRSFMPSISKVFQIIILQDKEK